MPANSDHVRRDAIHAARSIIRIDVQAVLRRLDEAAKARIEQRIADAEPGELLSGKHIGLEAAEAVLAQYVIDEGPDLEAPAAVTAGGEVAGV